MATPAIHQRPVRILDGVDAQIGGDAVEAGIGRDLALRADFPALTPIQLDGQCGHNALH
jgi:hypothetical protein